jgi:surface antigen
MDHVEYLKDIAKADVNALEAILADILTRKQAILGAVAEAERWIAERKTLVEQIITEENMGVLAWRDLIEEGKAKIRACYEAERDARVCRRELPSTHVPLKDMMSTFIGLVRAMKEIKDIPREIQKANLQEATDKSTTNTDKSKEVLIDDNISFSPAAGMANDPESHIADIPTSSGFANTGFGVTEKPSLGADSCFTNSSRSSPSFPNSGFGVTEKRSLGADSCFTNAGSSSGFTNTGFGVTEKPSLGADSCFTNAGFGGHMGFRGQAMHGDKDLDGEETE